MPTIRLVPSAYTISNTTYVVVADEDNMYENTDDTSNYCSIRGRGGRSSNSTYSCYIHGFNFDAVPSNATINSFTVKIRCYRNSYQRTGSSYRLKLGYTPNNTLSNTVADTDIDTTQKVITIPTGGRTLEQITTYGDRFGIYVPLRNTSTTSSNYPYVYVYGAEIEVDYTEPAGPDVRVKQNGSWVQAQKLLVKNNGAWVEASAIKAKSGGSWH